MAWFTSRTLVAANIVRTPAMAASTRPSQRSHASPKFGKEHRRPRQNNPDFCEFAGLRIDLDRPAMLLDDDVVADGEAKSGTFSGRLGREERIEDLFLHLGRNPGAVVADRYFHPVAEVLGRCRKRWLIVAAIGFRSALGRCIKPLEIRLSRTRVMSCGNTSASPAAGSNDRCKVILKPCFSARAP